MSTGITVCRTIAELRGALDGTPAGSLGLVPTMGALHQGHGTLIRQALRDNDRVVVSVFVNPLQFSRNGDCEDYRLYPRQPEADVAFLAGLGAHVVFMPEVDEMYPEGEPLLWVRTGQMGSVLEGASRPGHFDSVATVVSKLFHLIRPARAYFGSKDAQQVPIARAADGLAESSRNQRLSPEARRHALALSRALFALQERAAAGLPLGLERARQDLGNSPGVDLDYLVVVDPGTLEPLDRAALATPLGRPALALVAATVGGVRLIDNAAL